MLSAELSAAVLAVLPSPDRTIMGQAPWRDTDIHKPAVHDDHECLAGINSTPTHPTKTPCSLQATANQSSGRIDAYRRRDADVPSTLPSPHQRSANAHCTLCLLLPASQRMIRTQRFSYFCIFLHLPLFISFFI